MNWYSLVTNALITLGVTILGGLAVWFFTREPPPSDKLVYSIQTVGPSSTQPARLEYAIVKITNVGKKVAEDVRVVITFDRAMEIMERQVSSSAGASAALSLDPDDAHELGVRAAKLVADESISASILVRGPSTADPVVSARSSDSVAIAESVLAPRFEENSRSNRLPLVDWGILGVALLLQAVLLRFRTQITALFSVWLGREGSGANNSAFVLLHQGLTQQGKAILGEALRRRGGSPFEIANMGLAMGLSGKTTEADRYFAAAEWWAQGSHAKAVIEFNRAAVAMATKDLDAAEAHLSKALELSRKAVLGYCRLSVYVRQAAENRAGIKALADPKYPQHQN